RHGRVESPPVIDDADLPVETHDELGDELVSRSAESEHEIAGLDDAREVPPGEGREIGMDAERDARRRAGLELDAREADEALDRPDDRGERVVEVELDDLGT